MIVLVLNCMRSITIQGSVSNFVTIFSKTGVGLFCPRERSGEHILAVFEDWSDVRSSTVRVSATDCVRI